MAFETVLSNTHLINWSLLGDIFLVPPISIFLMGKTSVNPHHNVILQCDSWVLQGYGNNTVFSTCLEIIVVFY